MGKRLIVPGADFSTNAIEREGVEYTLTNGFASVPSGTVVSIDNNASSNLIRVRTDQIIGSYKVKTKTGYVIRAIATYGTIIALTEGNHVTSDAATVADVQGLSEYTLSNEGKYSIITFCKTDATQAISASEDIVDYIIRV